MLVNLQVVGAEVHIESDNLVPHSVIVNTFTKAKNRNHFAALLVGKLFDEETRVKSNVRGRGKEQLDPIIMEYVKYNIWSSCSFTSYF